MEGTPPERLAVADATFSPIPPYGSISVLHESADRLRVAGAWNFGPGSFDYHLPYDLFLHVIDGGTVVHVADEQDLILAPGDIAYLTSGLETTWESSQEIRTVFFCISDAEPIDVYATP